MKFADVVRQNPRLAMNVGELLDTFSPFLASSPNVRVHWVEEYARCEINGTGHRAGIIAITGDSLVLTWKFGIMYRKRGLAVVPRAEVASWELVGDDRLVATTSSGGKAVVEFRPASPEYDAFVERFRLIAPFGRSAR